MILGLFVTGNFTMHAGEPVVDKLGAENTLVDIFGKGAKSIQRLSEIST